MEHIKMLYMRKPTLCFLALSFVVVASAVLFCAARAESAEERVDEVVCYESVLICRGDSLWSIARENLNQPTAREVQSYVEEIIALNKLSCTSIHEGKYILIPKYDDIRVKRYFAPN